MSKTYRVVIVVLLACAVGAVMVMKRRKQEAKPEDIPANSSASVTNNDTANSAREDQKNEMLPRLVDLGAGKCIPCKAMAPILEEIKNEYAGKFDVEFIDVWENPKASEQYEIRIIPTQIFYNAAGKEIFRHEGFFGRDDILAKWKEYGIDVQVKKEK